MTTTYQLSDKAGDAIILVKVEAPDGVSPETAFGVFAEALQHAGLDGALDRYNQRQLAGAVAVAAPLTQAEPEPWGNPPVPAFQPAPNQGYVQQAPPQQPQLPAAAQPSAPFCTHGQRVFISGISQKTGREWKAWACPADRNDPSKCDKEWIR